MKKLLPFLFLLLFITSFYSCSTKRNTWYSRNYQAFTTRFNVAFNAKESYKEGIEAIRTANADDYSKVLPLYPISNHANASAATSQMERTIEKAQKAIKLHSIRKKPKRKPNRSKDPKYQAFMAREEYNDQISKAWILQGKGEFHKLDFLAAVGTFTYVIRHFEWDKNAQSEARIWLARTYSELDWYYDAEDMLDKANKEQVPDKFTALFSAARADLLLKQKRYKEAIPFLTVAAENEKDKKLRTRFYFVLAQLYRSQNDNEKAQFYYTKVIKANPSFEMELNARVNQAEADTKNTDLALNTLKKMLRKAKYAENRDKIFCAIGDIYLNQGQTDLAAQNYKHAIDTSKISPATKLQALVSLADLYYTQSRYLEAQPYYTEAASMMQPDNEKYNLVSRRAQLLGELNQQHEIVVLQDSLQALARLPESEQKAIVDAHIKRLQDEEAALKEKLERENAAAQASPFGELPNMGADLMSNGNQGDWYFYNTVLISGGKTDFQRKWGTRKLEDNWRRKNKASLANFSDDENENDETAQTDSISGEGSTPGSAVNSNPQFYLKQIPNTKEQRESSDQQIADALYEMASIYKENLEDIPQAIKTWEEFERRFPADPRMPDVYFELYRATTQNGDETGAGLYRRRLINQYPESSYAKALSQPDYVERMERMNREQDSLYQQSYFAYSNSDYNTVFGGYRNVTENYPLSPLIPKFLFLNALANGKTGNQEQFRANLQQLVTDYPQSDVSAMAKDILALATQGNEVQAGSSHGSIMDLREIQSTATAKESVDSLQFTNHVDEPFFIVISTPKEVDINKLQFDIALYNFTGFLVKNFDMEIQSYGTVNLLVISALDNLDEAQWYRDGLESNKDLAPYFRNEGCSSFLISESNWELMKKGRSLEDYLAYYHSNIEQNRPQIAQPQPTLKPEPEPVAEIPAPTTPVVPAPAPSSPVASAPVEVPEEKTKEPQATAEIVVQQPEAPKKEAEPEPQPELKPAEAQAPAPAVPVETKPAPVPATTFAVEPMQPHAYALIITKGTVNFDKLKESIDAYNAKNYVVANLKVSQNDLLNGKKIIIVGMLPNAAMAKNYLFGMIRYRDLFDSLQDVEYRSVIISQKNLDTLIQTDDVQNYLDFNRDHNMK
ncbi:MAG: tetratricopeptide repeat protein [Prevotellaceae bacterium]|nr:tetratricopeptide repeat protein [Prevotellaceae bacterium]